MFRSISLNYAKSWAKSLDLDVQPLLLARAERDRLNDGEIAAVHESAFGPKRTSRD
jgi:hypothetical protein